MGQLILARVIGSGVEVAEVDERGRRTPIATVPDVLERIPDGYVGVTDLAVSSSGYLSVVSGVSDFLIGSADGVNMATIFDLRDPDAEPVFTGSGTSDRWGPADILATDWVRSIGLFDPRTGEERVIHFDPDLPDRRVIGEMWWLASGDGFLITATRPKGDSSTANEPTLFLVVDLGGTWRQVGARGLPATFAVTKESRPADASGAILEHCASCDVEWRSGSRTWAVLGSVATDPVWDAVGRGLWSFTLRDTAGGTSIEGSLTPYPTHREVVFVSEPVPGLTRIRKAIMAPGDEFAVFHIDGQRLAIVDTAGETTVLGLDPGAGEWFPVAWGPEAWFYPAPTASRGIVRDE